ncbi:hypothetical protein [Prochlorothrix hollandica]|uniref:hypothetical protein n=2 Tax=Prochlorothrix hollandica TaxID=1223 RepID=UPI000344C6E4|nr:hypothetical protein [Prochlorothrix hollandica]
MKPALSRVFALSPLLWASWVLVPGSVLSQTIVSPSVPPAALDSLPGVPPRGLFRTVTLAPRFSPDPLTISGISGGDREASTQTGRKETETGFCVGYIGTPPDHRLVLSDFFDFLNLRVTSAGDTTLVVEGPGGTWCSDDTQGQTPQIGGQWLPGTYDVWVGSGDPDAYYVYELNVSEVE